MTEDQENKCHAIIHSHAVAAAAAGAGLAQISLSDNAVIVPIQVGMIISPGGVFGIELTKSAARAAPGTATATYKIVKAVIKKMNILKEAFSEVCSRVI